MIRLRDAIGTFLGYGGCERCGRSWWYAEMGEGVRVGSFGFSPLCARCESQVQVAAWPSVRKWLDTTCGCGYPRRDTIHGPRCDPSCGVEIQRHHQFYLRTA